MALLNQFKKFLIEKGYKPGDKIATEMELSKHFNASRNKIREAAISLCQLGILEKKPRRGTILKSLDPESVGKDLQFRFSLADVNPADFQEARTVVEKAILPLAVKRITPVLLAKLDEAVEEMENNIDNPEKADGADRKFHLILLEACGNQTLQTFGQVIQSLFRKENRLKYWSMEKLQSAVEDHRRLVRAIESSDTDLAVKIMADHCKY